jgi:hypothetical protein
MVKTEGRREREQTEERSETKKEIGEKEIDS